MLHLSPRASVSSDDNKPVEGKGTWTKDEHERFLHAIELYPSGPWKNIAAIIKTRTIRQTQTHAQKYREKLARRNRGLRNKAAIPDELAVFPSSFMSNNVPLPVWSSPCSVHHSLFAPSSFAVQDESPSFTESMDFLIEILDEIVPTMLV
ncbi:hypothetical protein H310_12262 [Aphanomyces invadans]|uniref:Uncharacterized protein n=1 Tax=Aphanomyces invadans TaxID=157072 RepID=A0A024TIR4_9STRA|nr:hypothetical protein H310_12262 [Aphanomyces invadans]ETV93918.1 hypothetical protein H310_12262 [Aphanomyces invadans]RHY19085.1 hypothetical protein DYB32_010287 [Aphanomyces invadans]RHY31854.1 hypothetical protein DYB32_003106 [Aphanomyces invadans]|eukprot:XP_008877478.1 hypothetical protein H310_12262 [Aphanomyces invadans]